MTWMPYSGEPCLSRPDPALGWTENQKTELTLINRHYTPQCKYYNSHIFQYLSLDMDYFNEVIQIHTFS